MFDNVLARNNDDKPNKLYMKGFFLGPRNDNQMCLHPITDSEIINIVNSLKNTQVRAMIISL